MNCRICYYVSEGPTGTREIDTENLRVLDRTIIFSWYSKNLKASKLGEYSSKNGILHLLSRSRIFKSLVGSTADCFRAHFQIRISHV